MANQAKMNDRTNGARESVPKAAARNMAELLHDLVTLAELQRRLLAADGKEAWLKIWPPAVLIGVGVVLALSCLPIGLVAIAYLLVDHTSLSRSGALGCVVLGGIVIAAALIGAAISWFRSRPRLFECSRVEWGENIEWLKAVLRRLSRSPGEGQSPLKPGTAARAGMERER